MKRTLIALLTLTTMIIGSNALAAGTATLNATATVLPSCAFITTSNTLDFADVDPTSAVPDTATTSFDYVCSAGEAVTWTLPATVVMTGPSANTLTADLTYVNNEATGSGVTQTLDVNGSIPVAEFANKLAGVYNGTATLTVTP